MVGISRQVFEAIACFKQGELTRLSREDAEQITDSIIRFVDSGSADISVRTALDRLSRAIRQIGTDRSRTSPIFQIRTALEEAENLLRERQIVAKSLEADYLKVETLKEQIRNLQQRESEIESDIRYSEYLSLQNLLQRLQDVSTRKRDIEAQLQQLKQYGQISLPNRDLVIKLMEERKLLRQQRQKLYETLRHYHEERQKTRKDLDALPPEHGFWANVNPGEFSELRRRWERLEQKSAEIQKASEYLKARLEEIGVDEITESRIKSLNIHELEERQQQAHEIKDKQEAIEAEKEELVEKRRKFNYIRIGIGVFLLFSFLIALAVQFLQQSPSQTRLMLQLLNLLKYVATPLALLWILVELSYSRNLRAVQESLDYELQLLRMQENELKEFLTPFGVKEMEELLFLLQRYREIHDLNHQQMAQIQEMKEIEQGLHTWLETFRFNRLSAETLQRIEEMLQQGTQLRRYLEELNSRIQDLEQQLSQKDQRLKQIREQLESILKAADCWSGKLEEDAATFFRAVEQSQKYDTLMQEWDQLNALEREMLGGRTTDQLRERLEQLEQWVDHQEARTNLPPQKELEKLLEEIQSQRQQLQIELAGLQERIAEREARLPDLSELEENMACYRRELEEYTRLRQALELAFETLSEVARETHQDFAPQLAKAVSRQLAWLTRNRYREVLIDTSDFSVRVAHDAAGTLIPIDQLSYGTREQIYLLMRMALSRYFARNAEKIPIFLDDPLAHADNNRQYQMLEILAQLSQNQQLFYLTKDESVVNTLLDLGAEYHLITLDPPEKQVPYRWAAGTAKRAPDTDAIGGGEEKER